MSTEKEQGTSRRRRYAIAAGAMVSGISLAGGSAAMAGSGASASGTGATSAHFQLAVAGTHVKPSKVDPAQKALNAYFKAGYDYDDAVKLAKIWHESPYNAKITAGDKLLAGEPLPIKHHHGGGGDGQTARQTREVDAFFNAGYTYNDAVKLAAIWHTADPYHAKLRGGAKLLAGDTLPIRPHH